MVTLFLPELNFYYVVHGAYPYERRDATFVLILRREVVV